MTVYRAQIEEAAGAIRLLSPHSFAWSGTPISAAPQDTLKLLDPPGVRRRLRQQLATVLYDRFYSQGATERSAGRGTASSGADPAFVARLSDRNKSSGGWQAGWRVRHVGRRGLAIEREGLTVWARTHECRPHVDTRAGSAVELRYQPELRYVLPGFYLVLGDEPMGGHDGLVRFYWNVTSVGAPGLIEELSTRLNRERVPFQLKVVNHPSRYARSDSAVLYVPAALARRVMSLAIHVHRAMSAELRDRVPMLTRRLAAGLAVAEDPGGGESFGTHRCALLAEGVLRADESGVTGYGDRLDLMAACFAEAGIDMDRPYQRVLDLDALMPQSDEPRVTIYPSQEGREAPPGRSRTARRKLRSTKGLVDMPVAIGHRLCDEAVWQSDACTWVGRQAGRDGSVPDYASLGPDLYGGTSGLAWFLTQLAATTGDDRAATTAIGAIRHALWTAEHAEADLGDGLFTGIVGVCIAAERVAALLGDDDLRSEAKTLIERRLPTLGFSADAGFDLVSGRAGVVAGLLVLHRAWHSEALLRVAADVGTGLMATANRTGAADSWASADIPAEQDLTGLSHGAAGPAWALAELAHATGRAEFRSGSARALAYERSCFDPVAVNWPDFRSERRANSTPSGFSTVWCHGATGIGLTRSRIAELLDDRESAMEATHAIKTVRAAVERSLARPDPSWGLCHGLAGNADALLQMSAIVGSEADRELAREVAAAGAASMNAWDAADQPLGLMTGIAGIGAFYLRLLDPAIPSVLLLVP